VLLRTQRDYALVQYLSICTCSAAVCLFLFLSGDPCHRQERGVEESIQAMVPIRRNVREVWETVDIADLEEIRVTSYARRAHATPSQGIQQRSPRWMERRQ